MFAAVILVTLAVCGIAIGLICLIVKAGCHLAGKPFPMPLVIILVTLAVMVVAPIEATQHLRMARSLKGTYQAFEHDAWPYVCGKAPDHKGSWSQHLEDRDAMLEAGGFTQLGGWYFYAINCCDDIRTENYAMYFWIPWK
jgi:hypothetical protein